jgi:hypothetical protein
LKNNQHEQKGAIMKLLIISLMILSLSGCSAVVPVKQKWPESVSTLAEPCPNLKTIDNNNVSITDMLKVIVENYSLYYQCANKVEGWNEWYKVQKEIFEKTNK